MLTILVGTDTEKRTKRLETLLDSERARGADIRRYSDTSFDPADLFAAADNVPLFGGKTVAVISGIGDTVERRDLFETVAERLSGSDNIFFLSENALPVPFMKKMKTLGAAVEEFDAALKKKSEAFNSFLLTDAYSARNRSQAWALYRAAISSGQDVREIHGKLFWVVKTMLLAAKTTTAAEAGMHSFPYGKAKTAAKAFAPGELEKIMRDLSTLLQDSMIAGVDLEPALESFILRSLEKPVK